MSRSLSKDEHGKNKMKVGAAISRVTVIDTDISSLSIRDYTSISDLP